MKDCRSFRHALPFIWHPASMPAGRIIQQNGFAEMRNVVIQLGKDSLTRFTAAMMSAQQHVI